METYNFKRSWRYYQNTIRGYLYDIFRKAPAGWYES